MMRSLRQSIELAKRFKACPRYMKVALGTLFFSLCLPFLGLPFWRMKTASQPAATVNPTFKPAFAQPRPVFETEEFETENDAEGEERLNPPCAETSLAESAGFGRKWLPLLDWVVNPETKLGETFGTLAPQLIAYTTPDPWPTIHERAQSARVPVIMYHDVLPEMQVFFDITPEVLERDFQLIEANGLTPISMEQLVTHLRTGLPLPEKPVLLTFDDGYEGHYTHVYPLMKKYGYPAVFSIFTAKVDGDIIGRSTVTWSQLQEMVADPLVEIVSHSVTHPRDLRTLPDDELEWELVEAKRILEEKLGVPMLYFTYPEGKYDERVVEAAEAAGYQAAMTMDDYNYKFAGESDHLLAIERFGQSQMAGILDRIWGGPPFPRWGSPFNFHTPIQLRRTTLTDPPLILISGGKPITIHADSRYQVPEIIADTEAIAAVDGAFFSLKYLDSNVMIGPVLSQVSGEFVPGNASENPRLNTRPLVLISPNAVDFVPFDADRHNTLSGLRAESSAVTDAFVAAAWLVRGGEPQPRESFGTLFDFDAYRHRAFWGINHEGQPVIGVSAGLVDSVSLGELLSQVGFREAVMLDSGASTSLAYEGESLVGYTPRPVPHVVGLVPPLQSAERCILASEGGAESEQF